MGGICGQIALESPHFDESILNGMVTRMPRRGPQVAHLRRPGVWFAAMDPAEPAIWPPNGREVVRDFSAVVDGVIDNSSDLTRDIERQGFGPIDGVAGLIAGGFRVSGPDFLEQLRGSFTAAVHDHDSETTWLVRDPFGTRPLYLHRNRRRLIFATDLRALLADPAVRPDLDPAQLRVLLSLGFNPAPHTLLKGIHKMPPGHLIRVAAGRVEVIRYDRPEDRGELDFSFPAAVDAYRHLLDRVVRRCDDGDRMGVLLSGGTDSSALVYLRARAGGALSSFALGFSDLGESEDERVPAWQAARALGAMHREKLIPTDDIAGMFPAAARILEEPVASGWIPPYLRLIESAQGQVPVVWSGQGTGPVHGEEAGWKWLLLRESVDELPPLVGRVFTGVARRLPGIGQGSGRSRILGAPEERERVLSSFALFDDSSLNRLLRAGHVGDAEVTLKLLDRWREPVRDRSPLSQALHIRSRTFLPEAVFAPATRIASESRITVRFPFADSEVIHWLDRLPALYRLDGDHGKRLHREALSEWVPADVLVRPKRSLAGAVARWFRGPGRAQAADWLLGPSAWIPCILDGVRVRRLIEETARGGAPVERLTLLIHLELWARETFLGGTR